MNRSAKLLSAAGLLLSLAAFASAGALDGLKASVSGEAASAGIPAVAAPKTDLAPRTPGDAVPQYLTGVAQGHVREFVDELFSDDGVMAVNVALDSTLKLPVRPIVNEYAAYPGSGFTVMCAGAAAGMPAVNWKVIKEYKAVQSELPVAVAFLTENGKLGDNLLEIERNGGAFVLRVKESPWKGDRSAKAFELSCDGGSLQLSVKGASRFNAVVNDASKVSALRAAAAKFNEGEQRLVNVKFNGTSSFTVADLQKNPDGSGYAAGQFAPRLDLLDGGRARLVLTYFRMNNSHSYDYNEVAAFEFLNCVK